MLRCVMVRASLILSMTILLSACAATPAPVKTAALITSAEAKSEACPTSILDAGASPTDCQCVEAQLFKLGQVPGALTPTSEINAPVTPVPGLGAGDAGKRKIAIGLLRLDAFEACGLFNPDHRVSRNLQRS